MCSSTRYRRDELIYGNQAGETKTEAELHSFRVGVVKWDGAGTWDKGAAIALALGATEGRSLRVPAKTPANIKYYSC